MQIDSVSQPQTEQPHDAAATASSPVSLRRKPLYFISGLGADERVFRQLRLDNYHPVHIRWADPEAGESLADYARRLAAQIQSPQPTLVGLSFGGMVAVEMAKQIENATVILISSAKTRHEIPPYIRGLRRLPIHRILPLKSMLWAVYGLVFWVFGLEAREERHLLRAILMDTDARFLKWAIHRVVTWRNDDYPQRCHHIHGGGDRIFPLRFVTPNAVIDRSGHFMVMNRADQVSDWLEEVVAQHR